MERQLADMGPNAGQWYKDAIFYEVNVRGFFDANGDGNGDLRGLTEKLHHHVETLERVVHHDILGADGSETIAAEIANAFGEPRRVGRKQQIRPVIHHKLLQIRQPDQPMLDENLRPFRIEIIGHQRHQFVRHDAVHRQMDYAADAPPL